VAAYVGQCENALGRVEEDARDLTKLEQRIEDALASERAGQDVSSQVKTMRNELSAESAEMDAWLEIAGGVAKGMEGAASDFESKTLAALEALAKAFDELQEMNRGFETFQAGTPT